MKSLNVLDAFSSAGCTIAEKVSFSCNFETSLKSRKQKAIIYNSNSTKSLTTKVLRQIHFVQFNFLVNREIFEQFYFVYSHKKKSSAQIWSNG